MVAADLTVINCIDDRMSNGVTNGVEIPGAVFGIIDAIKKIARYTEDEAWNVLRVAGLPETAHRDTTSGARGCGYAKIVEDTPDAVYAVEAVPAHARLDRIMRDGGQVTTYSGSHHPTAAVINDWEEHSFDPGAAIACGIGAFNYDRWAAHKFARALGMDESRFVDHLTRVFIASVEHLSDIRTYIVINPEGAPSFQNEESRVVYD